MTRITAQITVNDDGRNPSAEPMPPSQRFAGSKGAGDPARAPVPVDTRRRD